MLNKKRHNSSSRVAAVFSHVGFIAITGLLVGALFGWLLDTLFDTLPMLFLLFSTFGMAAAYIVIFFYWAKRYRQKVEMKLDSKDTPHEGGDPFGDT